jgi:4-phytase/acid phosphatase
VPISIRWRASILGALALAFAASDGLSAPDTGGDQLKLAIILTRHGVRSPLQSPEKLAAYASKPWPAWEVMPGVQTAHGNMLIADEGDYYRARYLDAGLLSGDPAVDGPLVYVRADNDQRTIETGRIIGKALVRTGEPDVHALPEGIADPLYRPFRAHVGSPDSSLAVSETLARLGNDATNLDRAYAAQFAELKTILFGPGGMAPEGSEFNEPSRVSAGSDDSLVWVRGPLIAAERCADAILLEYTQGMPASDVGWGKVDSKVMTDLLVLHELEFDLTKRTHYAAQVEGSNLASHILDTLEQAATGEPVIGALGPSGEKVVVLVGHDSNIASLGGLLGLDWWIPGTQANPLLPGGALVFELWKHPGETGTYFLKVSYVAQTFDQMREATAGSPAAVPIRCPIFVPDCSGAGPDHDASLASFVLHARRAIAPAFITTEPLAQLQKEDAAE